MWVPTVSKLLQCYLDQSAGGLCFHMQISAHEVFILFSPPVLLRRERGEWGSVMVEWYGRHLAATPSRKAILKWVVSWSIFPHRSVNIQKLGCGKPLKLVTTCMKPSRHDPASLCPRDCAINTYNVLQVCLWIYRWQKQEESNEAEPLPSYSPCHPSITYSTRGCARESCKARQVFNAQLQLPLGPENSCVHPLLSKGMAYNSLLWCFGLWSCLIYPILHSTTTDDPASLWMDSFTVHENTCLDVENTIAKIPVMQKKTLQAPSPPHLITAINCFLWSINIISAELNSTYLKCWPHTKKVMCHVVIYHSLVTVKLCHVCLLLAKVHKVTLFLLEWTHKHWTGWRMKVLPWLTHFP